MLYTDKITAMIRCETCGDLIIQNAYNASIEASEEERFRRNHQNHKLETLKFQRDEDTLIQ